jgi:hypothetical protein
MGAETLLRMRPEHTRGSGRGGGPGGAPGRLRLEQVDADARQVRSVAVWTVLRAMGMYQGPFLASLCRCGPEIGSGLAKDDNP